MERKIKQAFAAVEAGEALKEKTMARLAQRTGNFGERRKPWARRLAAAGCSLGAVCAAGLLGGWLYFTPTAAVHLDLEQPLRLSVNRFGLVVGADSPQEDEAALGETFQHRPVAQAVEAIVAESAPLAEEGELTIAVTGEDQAQCEEILSQVEGCAGEAACSLAEEEDLEAAQAAGLPYGKYRVYLQLAQLDPELTPQDVAGLSMKELRQRLEELAEGETQPQEPASASSQPQSQGGGNGPGQGQGSGQSHGNGQGRGSGQGQGNGQGHRHGAG